MSMSMSTPGERLVRPNDARERLSVGKTMFQTEIIAKGRLKFFKVGARSCACRESDLLKLIDELASGLPLAPAEAKPPLAEARAKLVVARAAKLRNRRTAGRYRGASDDTAA